MRFFSIFKPSKKAKPGRQKRKFNLVSDYKSIGELYRYEYKYHVSLREKKRYKNHFKKCQCINLIYQFNGDLTDKFNKTFELSKAAIIKRLNVMEEILFNYKFINAYETENKIDDIKNKLAEVLHLFEQSIKTEKDYDKPFLDPVINSFYFCVKNLNIIFSEIYKLITHQHESAVFITLEDKTKNITREEKIRNIVQRIIYLFVKCCNKLEIFLEKGCKNELMQTILLSRLKENDGEEENNYKKIGIDIYQHFIDRYKIENEALQELLSRIGLINANEFSKKLKLTKCEKGGVFFIKELNNDFLKLVELKEKEIFVENNENKRLSIEITIPAKYFSVLPHHLKIVTNFEKLECLDLNWLLANLSAKTKVKTIDVDFDKLDSNDKFDNLMIAFFLYIYTIKQEVCVYDSISKTNSSKGFDRLHKLIFRFEDGHSLQIQFHFFQPVYMQKKQNEKNNYLFYAKEKNISGGKHGKIIKLHPNTIKLWSKSLEKDRDYFAIGFELKYRSRVLKSFKKSKRCDLENEIIYDTLWQKYKLNGLAALLTHLADQQNHIMMSDVKDFVSYLIAMGNSEKYFNKKRTQFLYNKRGKSYHFIMPYVSGKTLASDFDEGLTLKRFSKIEFINFFIEFVGAVEKFLYNDEEIKFLSHNDIADRNIIYKKLNPKIYGKYFEIKLIDVDHSICGGISEEVYDYYYEIFLSQKAPIKDYYLRDLSQANPKKEFIPIVRTIIKGLDPEKYKEKVESVSFNNIAFFWDNVESLHELFNEMIKEDEYLKEIPELTELLFAMCEKEVDKRPSFSDVNSKLRSILEKLSNKNNEDKALVQNSP